MTYLEQLESWQRGVPVHAEQCCPDFSCCSPELLAPEEVRSLFVAAYKEKREDVTTRFLMTFMGNAFAGKNIYIAGLEASKREETP